MNPGISEPAKVENNLFPVFLKLDQLQLLLVGGGKVALEKLQAIIRNTHRRKIRIVAPQFCNSIIQLAQSHEGITLITAAYHKIHLQDIQTVFCAVNDATVSEQVCRDAHAQGLLVNVADKPAQCDFYLGAIAAKGQLKIAISTNGQSPTLARRIKELLQDVLPGNLDTLLHNLHIIRSKLKGDFKDKVERLNKITEEFISKKNSSATETKET